MAKYKTVLGLCIVTVLLLCSCDNDIFPIKEIPPTIKTPTVEEEETEEETNKATSEKVAEIEAENKTNPKAVITYTDLEGFWHSAPDFSSGEHASYEFFGDGWQAFYKDGEGGFYSGEWWEIKDDGILELILNRDEENYENKVYMTQETNIEYIAADTLTGNPALIIGTQKFWQMNKPQDIIDGSSLYINLDINFKIMDYQNRTAMRYGNFDSEYIEHIIIYCDTVLYDFKICSLNYDDGEDYLNFSFEDVIMSVEKLTPEHYIEYATTTPEGIPFEAITFSDGSGVTHTYLLTYNGRDGSTCVSKAESPELAALNLVKNYIAGNDGLIFEPLSEPNRPTYRFRDSNYMIQYDSKMDNQHYLIHEYEFVMDVNLTGEGHTVTSNWYKADIATREVIPMFNKDGNLNENY